MLFLFILSDILFVANEYISKKEKRLYAIGGHYAAAI